jgi:hypothetical protein
VRNVVGIVISFVFLFVFSGIYAQNSSDDFFDGNIDDLFADIPEDETTENPLPDTENPSSQNSDALNSETPSILADVLKKIGFTLDAGFNFAAGYSPGWETAPWYWENKEDKEVDNLLLAKMESKIALDIQVSDILRVRQVVSLAIPGLDLEVSEFFFDYNLLNTAFFRAGKYILNWGISPNFQYTNLPSRVPSNDDSSGDLYIARADIPVGIGGFQAAAMTRSSSLISFDIGLKDISFGLKYNAAVPIVDIDAGILYNRQIDTKAFISLKTTLFDQLELYSEALLSYNFDDFNNFTGSGSIGFVQEFFDSQLMINAELYYNGEKNSSYIQNESFYNNDNETTSLLHGFNTALNIRYKPSWLKKSELFLNYLHGFDENSVQLVPGFRITPLSNLNFYVAVPMALGDKDGYYYKDNADEQNRPFSIVMMLTFSGNYRYSNH